MLISVTIKNTKIQTRTTKWIEPHKHTLKTTLITKLKLLRSQSLIVNHEHNIINKRRLVCQMSLPLTLKQRRVRLTSCPQSPASPQHALLRLMSAN